MRSRLMIISCFLAVLAFGVMAQTQPVFRIGVLDADFGSLSQGAQLAVQEINAAGGVRGADGTIFQLELVVQPADNLNVSLANLNQASVIAVLGPERSDATMSNLATLQNLNVPVLTSATDDTLLAIDTTDRLFRLRAQQVLQGRALADYIVNERGISNVATVQLDIGSTAAVVGFTTALSSQGIQPSASFLRDQNTTITNLISQVRGTNPQLTVIFGEPAQAAELYRGLRNGGYNGLVAYSGADEPDFVANVPRLERAGMLATTTWTYAANDTSSQAFLRNFSRAFGELPDAVAASAYDGIYLIAEAIERPGDLQTNLRSISQFGGVQGTLNPASLGTGELSSNVFVTELGEFGAPVPVARYRDGSRVDAGGTGNLPPIIGGPALPTATPQPTATLDGAFITIESVFQNVRSGPGLNYDVIGTLPQGSTERIIGANSDFSWVVVNFRGVNGWLSRPILEVTGNLNTVPFIQPPPPPTPLPATSTPTATPLADIVVTNAQPTRLSVGSPFSVIVTVTNRGALDAGNFAVAASFQPGAVYAGVNLPGLGAGQTTQVTLTGTLNGSTGPQSVTIVADLNDQVPEGATGEANNDDYQFNYVVDRPVGTTGTVTIAPGGVITLDGSPEDLQWTGSELIAQNGANIYLLGSAAGFEGIHYDAINPGTNASPLNVALLNGALIGMLTDNTNTNRGVVRVDSVIAGGNISISYRVYQ